MYEMTLISCDTMAEQIRNEKDASSDDAYADDNKTDLDTSQ